MNILDNTVVTDIRPPFIVHSEKGQRVQMKNRQTFGLSLCINGQITYTMNGKTYVSDQNKAVLLPQGGTYTILGNKDGTFPVVNFACQHLDCTEIAVFPLENPQACTQDFETLKDLFLHNESPLKIYRTFYELLHKISCEIPRTYSPLRSVIQYIEQNIADTELSNTVLADKLHISEVYLRKLFLIHYQTTPKQYILDIRIRKAKQLLRDTSLTVAAIAEECGFSGVYHFCRMFKQKTGMTPTGYAVTNKIYKI